MTDANPIITRLRELLEYDPPSGRVRSKRAGRTIHPTDDGFTIIIDPDTRKPTKYKLAKLCYMLYHGVIPEKVDRVIQKDLDENNYKVNNLVLLRKPQYVEYKECIKNLNGGIKLALHRTDKYKYRLEWYEDGVKRFKSLDDVVQGKQEEIKLRLKFTKALTKFCIQRDELSV